MPYATDAELSEYARCPEVRIISNTHECQAVRKDDIGISSYVFYKAGVCEDIETDAPCIVTVYDKNGEHSVSVCDPTQKLERLRVTVRMPVALTSDSTAVSIKAECDRCVIDISLARSVGRAYRAYNTSP